MPNAKTKVTLKCDICNKLYKTKETLARHKKKYHPELTIGGKFKFTGLDNKEYELTDKQKKFAEFYLEPFIGSVDAVIEAGYDVRNTQGGINRNLARSIASENLMKPNVCQYIATLMEQAGLNDETVDKHMLYNITQFENLNAKMRQFRNITDLGEGSQHNQTISTILGII